MVQLDSKEGTGLYRHYLRGDAMDIYFYNIGLFRKPVANDEFSLFRCVSEQVYHSQHFYLEISAACQDYLSRHEFPRETTEIGRFIQALSKMYRRDFVIFKECGKKPTYYTNNKFREKVIICESFGNHFDLVFSKPFQNKAAICQAIVYQLLYKCVMDMPGEVDAAIEILRNKGARSPRPTMCLSEGSPILSAGFGDFVLPVQFGDTEYMREQLMNGPPFPYKVVKALDPVIYRNVEYDIWVEAKKEQIRARQDILKRLKFTPGDKCLVPKLPIPFGGVKAGGDPSKDGWYRGIVQDVIGEQGPVSVSVFVEELGERLIIPYAHLRSVPSESESELKPFHFSPPQSTDETSLDSSSIDSPEKSSSRKGSFLDHQETMGATNLMNHQMTESDETWRMKPTAFYKGPSLTPRQNAFPSNRPRMTSVSSVPRNPQSNLSIANLFLNPESPLPSLQKDYFGQFHQGYPSAGINGCIGSAPPPVQQPNFFSATTLAEGHKDIIFPPNNTVTDLLQSLTPMQRPWVFGDFASPPPSQPYLNGSHLPPSSPFDQPPGHGFQLPSIPPSPSQPQMPTEPFRAETILVPYFPIITTPFFEQSSGPVNFISTPSSNIDGSDLPLNDLNTLRYFYNLGCEYYRQYCLFQNQNFPDTIKVPPGFPPPLICTSTVLPNQAADRQSISGQPFYTGVIPNTPGNFNNGFIENSINCYNGAYIFGDGNGHPHSAPAATSTPNGDKMEGHGESSTAKTWCFGKKKFRHFRHRN